MRNFSIFMTFKNEVKEKIECLFIQLSCRQDELSLRMEKIRAERHPWAFRIDWAWAGDLTTQFTTDSYCHESFGWPEFLLRFCVAHFQRQIKISCNPEAPRKIVFSVVSKHRNKFKISFLIFLVLDFCSVLFNWMETQVIFLAELNVVHVLLRVYER